MTALLALVLGGGVGLGLLLVAAGVAGRRVLPEAMPGGWAAQGGRAARPSGDAHRRRLGAAVGVYAVTGWPAAQPAGRRRQLRSPRERSGAASATRPSWPRSRPSPRGRRCSATRWLPPVASSRPWWPARRLRRRPIAPAVGRLAARLEHVRMAGRTAGLRRRRRPPDRRLRRRWAHRGRRRPGPRARSAAHAARRVRPRRGAAAGPDLGRPSPYPHLGAGDLRLRRAVRGRAGPVRPLLPRPLRRARPGRSSCSPSAACSPARWSAWIAWAGSSSPSASSAAAPRRLVITALAARLVRRASASCSSCVRSRPGGSGWPTPSPPSSDRSGASRPGRRSTSGSVAGPPRLPILAGALGSERLRTDLRVTGRTTSRACAREVGRCHRRACRSARARPADGGERCSRRAGRRGGRRARPWPRPGSCSPTCSCARRPSSGAPPSPRRCPATSTS